MSKRQSHDKYSEAEAQSRFLDALKAGMSTPPKPLKDKPKVPRRGAKMAAKKAKKKPG
ncbi:hypothetical protein [Bradyrhizobium sp. Rc3b]|uniref:hypothetical protein n=1 Tax=Bradyrhizobium sp. Rc3b TaxID=1855322 RepID=UPI0015A663C3|nr:hypothetical protein [Bradyrhizobium sp. Rc3b]